MRPLLVRLALAPTLVAGPFPLHRHGLGAVQHALELLADGLGAARPLRLVGSLRLASMRRQARRRLLARHPGPRPVPQGLQALADGLAAQTAVLVMPAQPMR